MSKSYINATLEAAIVAADAAALAVWERDGCTDRGTCGGMMVQLSGRSSIARAAVERGVAYKSGSDIWLQLKQPEPIRSQNMQIQVEQYRAFMAVCDAAGFAGTFGRYWTFVD